MQRAERVTFGTSGLDRVAELRNDPKRLADAVTAGAKILPIWRGKPMLAGGDSLALACRRRDDPVLAEAVETPILIGTDDGEGEGLIFAQDISPWQPEGLDSSQISAFSDPTEQVHPGEETRKSGAAFYELRRVMTRLSRRDAEIAATARALLSWHDTHRFCANCGAASDIAMAGWQRDCPACGRHHFPRTDPVVIMLITRGEAVLVGRSPGWPTGMYSLLAGFVEPGETLEAAVRREVFEEAGIRVGDVSYLASQPWPFPASLMVGCRGTALSAEITIDPNEIEDARWVSRSQMLEIFAGQDPDIRPAREGSIAHFLLTNWLSDRLD